NYTIFCRYIGDGRDFLRRPCLRRNDVAGATWANPRPPAGRERAGAARRPAAENAADAGPEPARRAGADAPRKKKRAPRRAPVRRGPRWAGGYFIVGMTNSAPSLIPLGQREVTVLVLV